MAMLTSSNLKQRDAHRLAKCPGVVWVGRREPAHKLSPALDISPSKATHPLLRFLFQFGGSDIHYDSDRHFILLVLLVPSNQRPRCNGGMNGNDPCTSAATVAAWNRAWEHAGLPARAVAASDNKAYLHLSSRAGLDEAAAWLAARPEVLWLEERPTYRPLNAASKRILSNGPDATNSLIPNGGPSSLSHLPFMCSTNSCRKPTLSLRSPDEFGDFYRGLVPKAGPGRLGAGISCAVGCAFANNSLLVVWFQRAARI